MRLSWIQFEELESQIRNVKFAKRVHTTHDV